MQEIAISLRPRFGRGVKTAGLGQWELLAGFPYYFHKIPDLFQTQAVFYHTHWRIIEHATHLCSVVNQH